MDRENVAATVSASDIAIVGMAARFAGARGVDQFWANIRDGVEALTVLDEAQLEAAGVAPREARDPEYVRSAFVLDDMEMFDPGFFGYSPKEAAIMDPQHRHFLECSWEAMEHAGHVPERFRGSIGVYAGSGMNNHMIFNLLTNPGLVRSEGMFLLRHTGNDKDFLATRVSYEMNLTGPSVNVQTACSTSLVAIHLASQSLLNGECDMALAGGVTIKQPHHVGYRYEEGGVVSPDGHCRAFDAEAQGTVFGSGVGVVVLRRLADAVADGDTIHAVIKGSAINNDGAGKVGYLAPSVDRQGAAVAEAMAIAGVEPDTVSYVEAHGTGTPVGDPIEIMALTQAFRTATQRTGFCGIGSLKTNIGHTDTAAGVASVIKVVEALKHRQLPPSLHFRTPNPTIDFDGSPFYVNATLRPWERTAGTLLRAGVNSLGVGGTNAHLVLEEAQHPGSTGPSRPSQLLLLSAKTRPALERAGAALADKLRRDPELSLADAAYTLQVGRHAFPHRQAVVARDSEEAAALLESHDPKRAPIQAVGEAEPSVAFMFAGGGAQFPGMGAELYREEAVYREEVDRCLTLLARHLEFDLRPLLFPAPAEEARVAAELELPTRALPALFVTQYALAKLWMSWGIAPAAMIGHSMGEYTAAHLAGVFSLDDALALVALRGRLFETVPPGGMLSVPMPAAELQELLPPEISIAAVNAPELCVASGPMHAIEALERALAEREVEGKRIRISIAAHSAMLDGILERFADFFRRVTLNAPAIPFVSNVTGTWITAVEAQDPAYWVRHLRGTVRFADGVATLLAQPGRVLLEVGPGRVLGTLARLHPQVGASHAVLSSMRHPEEEGSDLAVLVSALGRLWLHGVTPEWNAFWAGEERRRVPLPTYSFERRRCWIEPGKRLASLVEDGEPHKRSDVTEWFYQPSWKRTLPLLGSAAEPERVLLLRDREGIADRVAERLVELGHTVLQVLPGRRFERIDESTFTVDPAAAPDFDTLIDTLASEGRTPRRVLHLWPLRDAEPALPSGAILGEMEVRSFYSLLFLAQAIGRADLSDPIALRVVTGGAHHVAGETALFPVKALAVGPCRVIGSEFPNLDCRNVDVVLPYAAGWQETRLRDQLVSELFGEPGEAVIAYRGPDRWAQAYEPAPLAPSEATRLREGGTYLITGGLGGIALEVAEELARAARVNLVLVGRTTLPHRSEWARWIELHGEGDRTGRRIRKIEAIEALGATVALARGDVTDADSLGAVVRDARTRFGAIHGVVHTAGVLDDGLILAKEPEAAARVLAPKVRGTLLLHDLLRSEPLDFFVLFSSRSAVTGIVGQIDYAAANAFLDAFAHYRTNVEGMPATSIGWSAWQQVGMVAEMVRGRGAAGAEAAGPADHPMLDRCVRATAGVEVFATDFSLGRHWVLDDHRIRGGEALIPGTGYLELARAASAHRPQEGALELSDVFFISPFMVRPGEHRELRVELKRNGDGREFVVRGSNGSGWHDHVTGHVAYRAPSAPRTHAVPELMRRCGLHQEVFASREREHLVLGERWNSLKRIDYGAGEALATLELPAAYAEELSTYALHPALLDVATACAQPLIPGFDPDRDFYVPASYTRLLAHRPLPQRIHSYIRFRPTEDDDGDMAVFDITILDEQGVEVIDISEFVMMRVRDKVALGGDADAEGSTIVESSAEATGSPAATLAIDLQDAILPGEGMDAFRRILAAGPMAQVIVSPQDLPRWLAHLRRSAEPRPLGRHTPDPPPASLETVPEVEAALQMHQAVAEAVVLARPDRQATRLVAYVVFAPYQDATVSELRGYLREHLPAEQVPQNFVELDQLPRDAAGEPDLHSLPDPFGATDDHVAPRSEAERVIAGIWQELLGVDRVSIHDNFLDIGGHSLLALRAITRIAKKTGVRLTPSALNLQTLEQIAAGCAAKMAPAAPAAVTVSPSGPSVAAPVPEPGLVGGRPEPGARPRQLTTRIFDVVRQTITRS
jgi:acyl transferase domain-containing protein